MTQSDLNVGLMAGASGNKLLQSRARGMLKPLSVLVAEHHCLSSFLPLTIFGILIDALTVQPYYQSPLIAGVSGLTLSVGGNDHR
jgi:hypothetical protein